MKIAFLVRSLDYGGMERQLISLAKGLRELSHSVVVVVFYANGDLEKELRATGVSVQILGKEGRWDILRFFRQLLRILDKENPDILHGFLTVPNILAILSKPFFPKARILWGIRISNMHLHHYDMFIRFTYWLERRLSGFPKLIIINSDAGKSYALEHGFPENKVVVIPNGVDTERFSRSRAIGRQKRAEWQIGDHEVLIGLVGRLDPIKDHFTFLRTAAMLLNRTLAVRFACIGHGDSVFKNKLIRLADQLGLNEKIIWAGSQNDMPSTYNALDIACSSSLGEGFSNVIAEAMACEVPCVVTDVGDSRSIVADTGIVVAPQDPVTLCTALQQMVDEGEDGRRVLGRKARQRIVNCFSVEKLTKSTEKALAGIL